MGLWESSVTPPTMGGGMCPDLLSFTFHGPGGYHRRQPLFIDAEEPSRSLNAAQLRLLVRTLVAGLKAHQVESGDCVLLHIGNSIIYPALFFSVVGAGGVYMGSNPRSQPHELEHILELAEPKLIITSRDALPTVLDVSAGRGMSPSQVCLVDEFAIDHVMQLMLLGPLLYSATNVSLPSYGCSGSYLNFANLLIYGEDDWVTFNDEATAKATPAAMFATSGTGGLPKAAYLSHRAVISQHLSINYFVPYRVTRLMSLPMFHLFGALFTHIFPVRYGQPLYILPRFEPAQFLSAIHQYQITETYMVPAMIHVLNRSSLPVTELAGSLRYVAVAGAPIDGLSMQQFQGMLHAEAKAAQLWGMTETGIAFQTRYGEPGDGGSIGKRLAGYDVCLVGGDGNPVLSDNCPGELYLRGPGLLIGYKGRDDALDQHGWFPTGDIAFVRNGSYYIVGRTKELIKVRGWQVAPAELEAVLLKHTDIEDAAVTGVTLKDGSTEAPRAYIVRRKEPPPNSLTAEEVYMFARRQLASYKALDGGIVFVEEIPRTPSGKIQRFKLSQMNTYREMVASLVSQIPGKEELVDDRIQALSVAREGRVTV